MTRTLRGLAALALVCVTTAACSLPLPGRETATSSAAPPSSAPSPAAPTPADGNPYLLPDDQKPTLFDPCTEIPKEVFTDPVYGGLDPNMNDPDHQGNRLHACTWKAEDFSLAIGSGWKSASEVRTEGRYPFGGRIEISGRLGEVVARKDSDRFTYCTYLFFTSRGSLLADLYVRRPVPSEKKLDLGNACQTLTRLIQPMANYFPTGDFQ